MALTPGTRLGVYAITAQIGEGGMGAVYRATDTSLGRQVAIKVLPDVFAADPDRLARFEREARTLASLNHPHIAAIYGFEKSEGTHALVMELVDGEDLSLRLARAAIPLDEALPIAKQIAEALEAAHEQGIIHRDLKPANIKVRPDGTVKVLDFGLAKAMEPTGTMSASVSMSPTITSPAMTRAGMILGTAAYMSPEQARGRTVDRRADIWAFGVVLSEMLTGRAVFEGDDVQDILGSVVKSEPDWTRLPAETPPSVRTLLRRCLVKDHKLRLQAIGEARITLENPGPEQDVVPPIAAPARSRVWPWVGATALLAAALPAAWFLKPAPLPAPLTLEVAAPEGNTFASQDLRFVISPNGRHATYVVRNREGQFQLGIRALDSGVATALAGTEGGSRPFWSPDSRSIGFFAAGKLQKIAIDGGRPQPICEATEGFATWNQDGVILFSDPPRPLQRVLASGGTPTSFLPLDESRHEALQNAPYFLPDGKHFLYISRTTGQEYGIAWASLDGKDRRFLIQNRNSPGSYAVNPAGGPGWIIYNSAGRLLAQPFDPETVELKGEPMLIADGVPVGPAWSTSNAGMISFPRVGQVRRQLAWVRRDGTRMDVIGEAGNIGRPSIAPNQKMVAFPRQQSQIVSTSGIVTTSSSDIYLFDLARNAPSRFTFESGSNPVWTPDASRLIYSSVRQGLPHLMERPLSGVGPETVLKQFGNADNRNPTAITKDGRWLSYTEGGGGYTHALFISRPEGNIVPFPVPRVDDAAISPDGQWVAYATGASGRSGIFVQSSPEEVSGIANTRMFQISTAGGRVLKWRADGKEIFYLSAEGMMMSLPVESGPDSFRGVPTALFDAGDIPSYDVTSNGQRFLLTTVATGTLDTPITVILNWPQLLRK